MIRSTPSASHRRSVGIPTSFALQSNTLTVNGVAQSARRGLRNYNNGVGKYPAEFAKRVEELLKPEEQPMPLPHKHSEIQAKASREAGPSMGSPRAITTRHCIVPPPPRKR